MFDRVVNIDHCDLQAEPSNAIRNAFRHFALAQGYTFYDVKNHSGLLRNLIIRTATTGEIIGHALFERRSHRCYYCAMYGFFAARIDVPNSIATLRCYAKRNDTIYDLDVVTHSGRGYIIEQLDDLRYKISPKSFFQ